MLVHVFLVVALRALSVAFGASGIFFLWVSFQTPALAGYAIVFLAAASAITVALPGSISER